MTFKNLQNMGIIVPTNFGLDKRLSSFKNEFYILEHIVQVKMYPKIQISLVSRTPKNTRRFQINESGGLAHLSSKSISKYVI